MTKTIYPATLLCDFYKVSHKDLYPKNTEVVYSTFTPRSNKYFPRTDKVVVFGIQYFVKKYLVDYFNTHFFNREKEDVVKEYERYIKFTLGKDEVDSQHISDLHDLGYLPVTLKALKEGTLAPMKVPVLTIENTDKRFFWLTNYLETLMSTEIWLPMTNATIANEYRKILDKYALMTTGETGAVDFQAHDFSLRGLENLEAGAISGASHLLSFTGTDSIPAIVFHEEYYNANIEEELVGTSIPATEHSVMSALTPDGGDEYDAYKYILTEVHPDGVVSVVSDTYDFWKVVGETLPRLKDIIMNRNGKLVVRPDSGNPVEVLVGKSKIQEFENHDYAEDYLLDEINEEAEDLCGEDMMGDNEYSRIYKVGDKYFKLTTEPFYNRYDKRFYYVDGFERTRYEEYEVKLEDIGLIESLWNIFGGTVTEQGYKVLDSHIGAIFGDSITLDRAEAIVSGLADKGFASTNVVLGIGSYTYQYNTRDTFGFAMKATYAEIDGKEQLIYKDPKTDDGTKKSQRGRVWVDYDKDNNITVMDGMTRHQETLVNMFHNNSGDLLETVFENGELLRDESLKEIREWLEVMNNKHKDD